MAYVHVNGVNLFYEISGEGHPLVLVHGSWANGSITWQPVVQGLAESFQVVTYDRRGHSQSDHPPGQGSRRQDEDDLAALIETLGLGRQTSRATRSGARSLSGSRPAVPSCFGP